MEEWMVKMMELAAKVKLTTSIREKITSTLIVVSKNAYQFFHETEKVTIVVLGNKCDLQDQRRVDHDIAQHWAKTEKVKLWETSVADRRSLIDPFVYLASKMTQPQSKSTFPLSRKNKSSGSVDG
uniref:NFKB inhibitor interacting Ras like 2 n=1 Tax=Laticauda laticaudata TaxID=8630 RepID=A0A8C5WXK3_LATLA